MKTEDFHLVTRPDFVAVKIVDEGLWDDFFTICEHFMSMHTSVQRLTEEMPS